MHSTTKEIQSLQDQRTTLAAFGNEMWRHDRLFVMNILTFNSAFFRG